MAPSRQQLPAWLVVGAPKCGTTSLAEWLRSHPQVFVCPRKELEFFDSHWERGLDWYAEQFAGRRPGQVSGEATPTYWYEDLALDRIRDVMPDARLLVLLREPVGRLWSQAWFMQMLGVESRSPIRRIDRLLQRPDRDPGPGLVGLTPATRYAPRIAALFDRFPREQVAIEFFDDLVRNPAGLWQRVCRHIGVDPAAAGPRDAGSVNPTRVPRAAWLQRLLFRIGRSQRWQRAAGERGTDALRSLMQWNAARRMPPLPTDLRARLNQVFRPDLEEVQKLLGRPVPDSWWGNQ